MTVRGAVARPTLGSWRIGGWVGLLFLEAVAVVGYFALTAESIGAVRYTVYPFVWINAGLWAVLRTSPSPADRNHRLIGVAVGIAYFIVVMAIPGKIGLGVTGAAVDLRIGWYVPGWGPLIAVGSPWLRLFLVPFEVIGYAALAYLVYANVLVVTRGALSGVLGLVTCVGCTVPVLAPIVGLLGGPASSLTSTAYAWSYDIGTLVFLTALGLLYASHEGILDWR